MYAEKCSAIANAFLSFSSLAIEIASSISSWQEAISPKCQSDKALKHRQTTTGESTCSTGDCTPPECQTSTACIACCRVDSKSPNQKNVDAKAWQAPIVSAGSSRSCANEQTR